MSEWFGVAASAAGGGVFGMVGTALGRVVGLFEKAQDHRHEKDRWKHDESMRQLDMNAAREAAEAGREMANTEGRWAGLTASIEADADIAPSYKWVDAVRGLTRPSITLLLWIIAAIIFFNTPAEGRMQLVETVTFAATAATLWWFGDRGPTRGPRFDISAPSKPSSASEAALLKSTREG